MTEQTSIFCPFCGNAMQRKDAAWHCERGGFYFSKLAQDAILEAIEKTPAAPLPETARTEQKRWGFCPRCGQRLLKASHGSGVCPSCSLLLRGAVFYMLNEYCRHRDQSYYIGDPAYQSAPANGVKPPR
jgi:ribosomal protein L37AE/L43A